MDYDNEQVDENTVLSYFENKSVLDHYEEAARKVGLWATILVLG